MIEGVHTLTTMRGSGLSHLLPDNDPKCHLIGSLSLVSGVGLTLDELVAGRRCPLGGGVSMKGSCCMSYSTFWDGGTNRADLTEIYT